MGKKTLFGKKISVVLLSLMMGMSNVGVTAYAEEQSPVTETSAPQESAEPTSTATAEATPDATAQPTATATASAETAKPSATPEATAASAATAAPTAKATAVPSPSASAEAEETLIEVSKPSVDTSDSSIYYATDIIDYVAALSSVRSTADNKLIVHSFDDISDCIQNGKALYFDGAYIIVFDSAEDLAASKEAITDKLGDVVFDDEAISVDIGSDDGTDTSAEEPQGTIEANSDVAATAEEAAEVADEAAANSDVKTIALIDSGVNDDYADVSVNLTTEEDGDLNGHGTALAKIIKDWAGDQASIISIKAFHSDGTASISTVAAAVKYARMLGVDIINISASVLDSDNTEPLKQEVQNALDAGVKVVASAGNDADDAGKYVPANIDGVDTVGAAEPLDGWSAFKATATTNVGDCVDYYYIADSTSEAAAMESAIIASHNEDQAYSKTGKWLRFEKVADRDETVEVDRYDGMSLDELEEKQGFLTYDQEQSRDKVRLNDGHGRPWTTRGTADGGTLAFERYQDSNGDWDWHASTFYYYAPGTYSAGAKGVQIYCQDPDIKAWPENASYNCVTSGDGTIKVQGDAYDGVVVQKNISFNGASVSAYDPAAHSSEATAYVWTDSNGFLAQGGYDAPTVSVGNGDSSKVHVKVNGNSLLIWFDEDWTADMPDDITVTISGGDYKEAKAHTVIQQGEASSTVSCAAPGRYQHLKGGSDGKPEIVAPGEDGYSYNPASVHLNILRGDYTVHKVDANRDDTTPQGDATLAGAVYEARHGSIEGSVATTATTNESGITKLSNLKWGAYFIMETAPSAGYNLDKNVYKTRITASKEDPNKAGADLSEEVVIRGGLAITKNDSDFKENAPQGDAADLSGAQFDVYNVSSHSIFYYSVDSSDYVEIGNTGSTAVTVDGKSASYGSNNYVLTLTTDANGNASTPANSLSYGTYLIVEKKAPVGYVVANDENADVTGIMAIVSIRNEGEIVHADLYDDVARGQLIVGKVDSERMANYPDGSDAYDASPDTPDTPQGDATLAGAEFTIYLKSANHVMVKDADGKHEVKTGEAALTIVSDADGIAKTIEDALPYGSYYVVETKAPEGYLLNADWRLDFNISKDGQVVDYTDKNGNAYYTDRVADQVIRGGVELTKFDTDRQITQYNDKNTPQGDATLAGAQFTIYNLSKQDILSLDKAAFVEPNSSARGRALAQSISEDQAVATITTDATGYAKTADNALPYGTYLIKETKETNAGYILNDYWYSIIEVREDGHVYNAVDDNLYKDDQVYDGAMVDDVIRGGVKLQKVDAERDTNVAQGDATLKDAEITIYNISTLDVYGAYDQDSADAPQYDGKVGSDGNRGEYHWITSGDTPTSEDADADVLHKINGIAGDVSTVVADNAKSGMTDENGKYAYITNDAFDYSTDTAYDDALQVEATQESKTDHRSFENAQPVVTIKTDENGVASLGGEALPYGTYVAVETKPSRGYMLNAEWQVVFQIREDGVIVDLTDSEHQLAEQVIRGDVRIYKEDLELSELNGIDRTNYGYKADNTSGNTYSNGENNSYSGQTIPTTPIANDGRSGYTANSESDHVASRVNGVDGEAAITSTSNPSQAIGGNHSDDAIATLSGIEFAITNKSTISVLSDAGTLKEYQPGEFVTKIYSHYDDALDTDGDGVADTAAYVAETTGKALPYGTYQIQETATNAAYLLTDGTPRTFEIEYDGEIADTTKQTHHTSDAGEELVFRNQIKRGDFDFVKMALNTASRIQGVWVLENDTSGEKHVIVTDKNGEYKSYTYSHSDNTNANDFLLDQIGDDYENEIDLTDGLKDGSITETSGLWFGMGEDGLMSDPSTHDGLAALPYGQYTLHEVRTDTNRGYDLKNVTFYVYQNSTVDTLGNLEKDSPIHLGTIPNAEAPQLSSVASADDSGDHTGTAGTTKAIIDKVSYEFPKGSFEAGTYQMTTSLVNAATGAVLTDADGNELTKTQDVELTKRKGTIDVQFDVDTTHFDGISVVVFESLTQQDEESEDGSFVRVAAHNALKDAEQTVTFAGIRTHAADTTASEDAPASGTYYITDNVSYTGLIPGETYTLSGTLHIKNADETDGGALKDSSGKEITASTEFTPDEASGTVGVKFEVPAALLAGKTVVAFEELQKDGTTIAVHADITDSDQTVNYPEAPEIHTTAVNAADNSKVINVSSGANASIKDTIAYSGLIPGETYTVTGTIHVNDGGNDAGELLIGGKSVTASAECTPDEASGTVDVIFEFSPATLKANTKLVAFETVSLDGRTVATHADISDEGQTVTISTTPGTTGDVKIGTTATAEDGVSKTVSYGGETTIVDVVNYSGLTFGSNYELYGEVHRVNADGEDKGIVTTSSKAFTASGNTGDISVEFTVDTAKTERTDKLVVVEQLYDADGSFIAEHRDLTDEGQTVTYPPEKAITIHTTAKGTNVINIDGRDATITDVIDYEGLEAGTAYRFVGTIHVLNSDGTDGGELKSAAGDAITASVDVTPEKSSGNAVVTFSFKNRKLDNAKALVVFERLYTLDQFDESRSLVDGAKPVAEHADLTDTAQTVEIAKGPSIHTTAVNKADKSKNVTKGGEVTIVDTVDYTGLVPSQKYRLSGEIHTSEDKVLAINGSALKAEITFTPAEADGSVDVEFPAFSTAGLAEGTKLVVFETLTAIDENNAVTTDANGTMTIEHKDLNDQDQTVTVVKVVPKIGTTAKVKGGDKTVVQGDKVTIVDTISYENLVPGQKYEAIGEIHTSRTTALAIGGKKITKSVVFTPEKSSGTVEVTFDEFSTASLDAGTKLVVFESVYPIDSNGQHISDSNGTSALEHKDMNDQGQTITITERAKPSIKTTATFDDGTKAKYVDSNTGTVTINDVVSYENLEVGKAYTLYGVLMDKDSQTAISVISSVTFTPTVTSGTVTVPIAVNGSKLQGHTGVAFEELYEKDSRVKIAEHKDLNDADQTVRFTATWVDSDAGRNTVIAGTVAAATIVLVIVLLKNKKKGAEK